MGAMNAMGHLLCASAGGSVDEMWDLVGEMYARLEGKVDLGPAPSVHGFGVPRATPADQRPPRYCFHPTGEPHVEFRGDDLNDVLLKGAAYLGRLLPEDELWRRD